MCVYDAHKCAQIVNITHRRFEQVLCNLGRVEKNRKINHLFQQTELIHRNFARHICVGTTGRNIWITSTRNIRSATGCIICGC